MLIAWCGVKRTEEHNKPGPRKELTLDIIIALRKCSASFQALDIKERFPVAYFSDLSVLPLLDLLREGQSHRNENIPTFSLKKFLPLALSPSTHR